MTTGDLVVLNRRDFFEFCAALNQFPDWPGVQAWIAANEITAPDMSLEERWLAERQAAADVLDEPGRHSALVDRLDAILDALRELRGPIEKAGEVGEVFTQFGQMMGMGEHAGAGYSPNAINVLASGAEQ